MWDKVGENVAYVIFLSKCGDELDLCSSIHFNAYLYVESFSNRFLSKACNMVRWCLHEHVTGSESNTALARPFRDITQALDYRTAWDRK